MKKTTVLVADDNAELRSSMQIQLAAAGYDVVVCENADLAVAYAQKYAPDVMLVDIWMQAERRLILGASENGLGVLERIAEIPQTRGIPIIHITGGDSPQLDLRAKALGAYGLIHKPINMQNLIKTIESAVRAHPRCCGGAGHGQGKCGREISASAATDKVTDAA